MIRRLLRSLSQPVTVLVIPHMGAPLARVRITLAFMLFAGGLWTGFTLWAGYLAGHRVDYWITKLDNQVLRRKVRFLAREMTDARGLLERTRDADDQLRRLLGMRNRQAVIEGTAVGGPSAVDRLDISRLAASPDRVPEPEVQRELVLLRRDAERRLASFQEIGWYIATERSLFLATPNVRPADGRLTSPFGYRFSPFGSDETFGEFHPGLDIANETAAEIVATADGRVRHAGWSGGYGQMVLIDHGHSYSTLYGHTAKIVVQPGDTVRRGDVIAYMGTTGRSTGTHLHYEVWRDGRPVNPLPFLGPRASPGTIARAAAGEEI